MSKKKPIEITINKKIKVLPENIYETTVVKSGSGAAIKSYKKFIGEKAIVIISRKDINMESDNMDKKKRKEIERQKVLDATQLDYDLNLDN